MPLPKPKPAEGRQDFLNRCMDNETMKTEYPGESQRFAVCQSQWESGPAAAKEPELVTLTIGTVVHESYPKWK